MRRPYLVGSVVVGALCGGAPGGRDAPVVHLGLTAPTGLSVPDVSPNGNDGRIHGRAERFAEAGLRFSGESCVVVPEPRNATFGGGPFTMEVVVRIREFPDAKTKACVIASCSAPGTPFGWGMDIHSNGEAVFYGRTTKGQFICATSVPLPLGEFVHLAGSRNEAHELEFRVNGRLQERVRGAGMDCGASPMIVVAGAPWARKTEWLRGTVRDFRVFRDALVRADDAVVKRGEAYRDLGTRQEELPAPTPLPPLGEANPAGLRVIDRDIRFVGAPPPASSERPPPYPDHNAVPAVTPLPRTIASPYRPGVVENVMFAGRRALTSNIYVEPGRPWVLHVGIVSPHEGDTLEGARTYRTWYRTSRDGGQTFESPRPVVKAGDDYSPMHPVDGVWIGRNSYSIDFTRPVVRASNGEIMVPFGYWPLGPDGKLSNPAGAFTYWAVGVLVGRWTADGADVVWDVGDWVDMDWRKSPRGLEEPAVVELRERGHFMLVARGSNETTNRGIPGRKWVCFSHDYCRTWSVPRPLPYADGTDFFSPNSCSALVRSSTNRRVYWIGNISPRNTDGNNPRYPLVIAELDEDALGLVRRSVLVLDARHPQHDSGRMGLSNFHVYEDTVEGTLLVTLKRADLGDSGWETAPCWYLVGVPGEERARKDSRDAED